MKLPDLDFDDALVVLTGAASGMGEEMALQLASAGARLVLIDVHADRLADVRARLQGPHATGAVTHVADLGDRDQLVALGERLAADHPQIDVLINNAGVALFGRFDEMTLDDFEWVTNINLRAPVYLTHYLLPSLKARRGSHIINMSSLFGILAPAGQSAYCTSKYGLRGFGSALAVELDGQVGVTTVHPGGIATRIATEGRRAVAMDERDYRAMQKASRKLLKMSPAKAAAIILKAAQQRKERVLVGTDAKVLEALSRVAAPRMNRLLAAAERRMAKKS